MMGFFKVNHSPEGRGWKDEEVKWLKRGIALHGA